MHVKRIVFCIGELETLDYFSFQLADAARKIDIETFFINTKDPETYMGNGLDDFTSKGECIAIFLNQVGINLTAGSGANYWDSNSIPVYSIQVDHPRNFSDALIDPISSLNVISIDRKHADFIRTYYPRVKNCYFLPLAGAKETDQNTDKDIAKRNIDILYTGSCHPKVEAFPPIGGLPSEGKDLYDFAINLLLTDPSFTTEEAIAAYFFANGYSLPAEQMLMLYTNISHYIETYVRREWKFKTIEALDEAGFQIEIYGDHWIADDHPLSDNIRIHERISSADCNRLMGNAKITLNFMPWFKDGSSERPFNTMLNRSVCLIDKSDYLTERFVDDHDILFFDLTKPNEMTARLKDYMHDTDKMQMIADAGYTKALHNDTWKHRLERIIDFEN